MAKNVWYLTTISKDGAVENLALIFSQFILCPIFAINAYILFILEVRYMPTFQ